MPKGWLCAMGRRNNTWRVKMQRHVPMESVMSGLLSRCFWKEGPPPSTSTLLKEKLPRDSTTISSAKFPAWMLPQKVKNASEAIANFRSYMTEMVEEERLSIANGEGTRTIL
jgi:hypothetical protein